MTNKDSFDFTMMSDFLTCRRLYDFRHNKGYRAKRPATALAFGGAIGKALDSWYTDKDVSKAIEVFKANYKEDIENDDKRTHVMGEWILKNYDEKYRDHRWKMVHKEMTFKHPLPNGNFFMGRVDKVIDWDGTLWGVDHKAQPIDSLVLTPAGWKTIGAVKTGDFLIGSRGEAVQVTGVYPQGALNCFDVSFSDGAKVRCSDNHLWSVANSSSLKYKTMTLRSIMDEMKRSLGKTEVRSYKFRVPSLPPVKYSTTKKHRPLHPYMLGVLLGDGCITGNVIEISMGNQDVQEMCSYLNYVLPNCLKIEKCKGKNFSWMVKCRKKGSLNPLIRELKRLNLMGLGCASKSIPQEYLFGGLKDRWALLQGLLDTDGCCHKGHIYFDTVSEKLGTDVVALVRSLGGTARIRTRAFTNLQAYRVSIRFDAPVKCFRLRRKQEKMRLLKRRVGRYIEQISPCSSKEMVCISVSAKDGLYVTNDFVLTHNTTSQLGGQFFNFAEPNMQFPGYSYALIAKGYDVKGFIVDAILVAKGLLPGAKKNANLTPCARFDVYHKPEVLAEWLETVQAIQKDIKQCEDTNTWYPNLHACQTKYGDCEYRKVCKEDKDIRQRILDMDYEIKFWDPLASAVDGEG